MKKILMFIGIVAFCAMGFAAKKAVIITGQNNHAWQKTTPFMQSLLEEVGFEVEVCKDVSTYDASKLKNFDLIVSNWGSYNGDNKKTEEFEAKFSQDLRTAHEKVISAGTGHLAVHAGTSPFPSWPEYAKFTLGTWVKGKTFHGKPCEFTLEKKGNHKSTASLPQTMKTFDEMWENIVITNPEAEVVIESVKADGKRNISALVGKYGKGKCAVTFLGHSVEYMKNDAFKDTFKALAKYCTK